MQMHEKKKLPKAKCYLLKAKIINYLSTGGLVRKAVPQDVNYSGYGRRRMGKVNGEWEMKNGKW